jgi:hypothetical protein
MAELKRLVVKADSWKIFFVFVGSMLFYGITPDEQSILKIVASILLAVVIFGWFLILGTSLNDNLPEDQQKSDALFIISCFYGILLVSVSAILKDTAIDEEIAEYVVVLIVLFGLSFFYVIYFTSTLYTSNQERFLDKEKLSAEVIFILFIAFIFGVLVLQSRVKKFFT